MDPTPIPLVCFSLPFPHPIKTHHVSHEFSQSDRHPSIYPQPLTLISNIYSLIIHSHQNLNNIKRNKSHHLPHRYKNKQNLLCLQHNLTNTHTATEYKTTLVVSVFPLSLSLVSERQNPPWIAASMASRSFSSSSQLSHSLSHKVR